MTERTITVVSDRMPLPTKLVLPNMAAKDPQEALESAESDIETRVLKVQVRGAQLLTGREDPVATAERIAWLAMWTRVFLTLDAARAALWKHSSYALLILERATTEAATQLHAVIEPAFAAGPMTPDTQRQIVDRFRAFTAWALWSDREALRDLVKPGNLSRVWDPEPVRRVVSTPEVRERYEELLGELDVQNEHDLERERVAHERRLRGELGRLDDWLADPSLADWCRELERRSQGGRTAPLFQLFDPAQSSYYKRLKATGHEYTYGVYKQQSGATHGGSLDPFLVSVHGIISPRLPVPGQRPHIFAENIALLCAQQFLYLALAKPLLWPADSAVAG